MGNRLNETDAIITILRKKMTKSQRQCACCYTKQNVTELTSQEAMKQCTESPLCLHG